MDTPKNDSTLTRVRRVFIDSLELNIAEDGLDYASRLDELAGFDSAAAIVFLAALEKEFHITVEPEKLNLEFLCDPRQLAAYLEERTRG